MYWEHVGDAYFQNSLHGDIRCSVQIIALFGTICVNLNSYERGWSFAEILADN